MAAAVFPASACEQTEKAPPPANPALQVKGETITSTPLGLLLQLTEGWETAPLLPGADLIARHKLTGAILVGSALVSNPASDTLDMTLDKLMAGRRDRYGEPTSTPRRDGFLGELPARVATMSVPRDPEAAKKGEVDWVTLTLTIARKGPYTVHMTCKGDEDGQAACDALLKTLKLAK